MAIPLSLHLFCRVVDNFGDIGVCWRLAQQLQREHGIAVSLWVDDLTSFQRICANIDAALAIQHTEGVIIRHWCDDMGAVMPDDVADVVIEAFACELPLTYLSAMSMRKRKPIWINLEYLSAETWVEGCHGLVSHHPSLPLTKYFFFPGFSDRTGGLLFESNLVARRDAFQKDASAVQAFLVDLGIDATRMARRVSLFCYPDAPVESLFDVLREEEQSTLCLVPEGVASVAVGAFLRGPAIAGASATAGALTVHVLPFIDQPEYDKLLWACDLNFVRGEDSFVRAQWAARPFVWHIYPQEEDAHWGKLDAFLGRYAVGMPDAPSGAVTAMWRTWNAKVGVDMAPHWRVFRSVQSDLSLHAQAWSHRLRQNGDLASNLVQFIKQIS